MTTLPVSQPLALSSTSKNQQALPAGEIVPPAQNPIVEGSPIPSAQIPILPPGETPDLSVQSGSSLEDGPVIAPPSQAGELIPPSPDVAASLQTEGTPQSGDPIQLPAGEPAMDAVGNTLINDVPTDAIDGQMNIEGGALLPDWAAFQKEISQADEVEGSTAKSASEVGPSTPDANEAARDKPEFQDLSQPKHEGKALVTKEPSTSKESANAIDSDSSSLSWLWWLISLLLLGWFLGRWLMGLGKNSGRSSRRRSNESANPFGEFDESKERSRYDWRARSSEDSNESEFDPEETIRESAHAAEETIHQSASSQVHAVDSETTGASGGDFDIDTGATYDADDVATDMGVASFTNQDTAKGSSDNKRKLDVAARSIERLEKKVAELVSEADQLRQQRQDFESQLDEQTAQIQKSEKLWHDRLSAKDKETSKTRSKLDERVTEIANLERKLKDVKSEQSHVAESKVAESAQRVEELTTLKSQLENDLAKERARVGQLETELTSASEWKTKLESADSELKQLHAQLADANANVAKEKTASQEILDGKTAEHAQLLFSFNEMKSNLSTIETEFEKSKTTAGDVDSLRAQLGEKAAEVDAKQQVAEELNASLTSATSEAESLRQKLSSLESENESARKALEKAEADSAEIKRELTESQSKFATAQAERETAVAQMQAQLEEQKIVSSKLEDSVSSFQVDSAKLKESEKQVETLKATEARLGEENQNLKKEFDSANARVSSLENEKVELGTKFELTLGELEQSKQGQQEMLAQLDSAEQQRKSELAELQRSLSEQKSNAEKTIAEKESLAAEIADSKMNFATLESSFQESQSSLSQFQAKSKESGAKESELNAKFESTVSEYTAQIEKLNAEKQALAAEFAVSKTELDRLQSRSKESDAKEAELNSKLVRAASEHAAQIEKLDTENQSLAAEVAESKTKLAQMQSKSEASGAKEAELNAKLESTVSEYSAQIEKLDTEKQSLAAEVAESKTKLAQMQSKSEASGAKEAELNAKLESTVSEYSAQIEKFDAEKQSLAAEVAESKTKLAQMQSKSGAKEAELNAKLESTVSEYTVKIEKLNTEKQSLAAETAASRTNLASLESSFQETKSALSQFRAKVEESGAKEAEFETSLKSATTDFEARISKLKQEKNEYANSISQVNEQKAQLENNSAKHEIKLNSMLKERDALVQEVGKLKQNLETQEKAVGDQKTQLENAAAAQERLRVAAEIKLAESSQMLKTFQSKLAGNEGLLTTLRQEAQAGQSSARDLVAFKEKATKAESTIVEQTNFLKKIRAEKANLASDLDTREKSIEQLQLKIVQLTKDKAEAASQVKALTIVTAKNEKLFTRLELASQKDLESKSKLVEAKSDLNSRVKERDQTIRDLQKQIKRAERQTAKALKATEKAEQKLAVAKARPPVDRQKTAKTKRATSRKTAVKTKKKAKPTTKKKVSAKKATAKKKSVARKSSVVSSKSKTKKSKATSVKSTPPRKLATPDNLKRIEGIGPKIEKLLHSDGVKTFNKLASTPIKKLNLVLEKAGPRFQMHDPSSWPQQSALAAKGQWEKLQILQDKLDGGRTSKRKPAKSAAKTKSTVKTNPDDLTRIEGIGPAIRKLLNKAGITTFRQLSKANTTRLNQILDAAGARFNIHNPESWPQQSKLAANGNWKKLDKLQAELDGGR